MSTVAEMRRRFQAVNLIQIAAEEIAANPQPLADANRAQLKKGVATDGGWLLRYRDDPYFKGNMKWAIGYENYKSKLPSTDPAKPREVADYFINGYTHDHVTVEVRGSLVYFGSTVPWGPDIDAKNNNKAFGLSPDSKIGYRNAILLPAVVRKIKIQTGTR